MTKRLGTVAGALQRSGGESDARALDLFILLDDAVNYWGGEDADSRDSS